MRAVFLDRDGTITKSDGYFCRHEQIELADDLADAIKILNKNFLVIIVTNQPVVARGLCSEEDVRGMHARIVSEMKAKGARIDGVYFCPHHPEQHEDVPEHAKAYRIKCNCRKPATGLIEQAAGDFGIDVGRSFFIGDSTRDVQTAKNAGCTSVLVKTGQGGGDGKYDAAPDYVADNMAEAAKLVDRLENLNAVILVGGRGERMGPLTDALPKPMLPIRGVPIMERQIKLLKRHGIRNMVVCGHYLFGKIKDYFGDGSSFGVRLTYVDEAEPLGTGGAVKNAEEFITSDDFVLFNGDVATNVNVGNLIKFHLNKKSLATLVLRVTDHPLDSDAVEVDSSGLVTRFIGRDQEEIRTANTGIMMLSKGFLKFMQRGFSSLEKDHIARFAGKEKIYGYVSSDYFKDIGTIERYNLVQEEFLA